MPNEAVTEVPFETVGGSPIVVEFTFEGKTYRGRLAISILKVIPLHEVDAQGNALFQFQTAGSAVVENKNG